MDNKNILKIYNKDIKHLWLNTTGLANSPTGSVNVSELIKSLGFVQIDTIQNVTRAHHHILWSRNQNYQEQMLDLLLKNKKAVFEHFTHDASIIPIEFYPMWTRQFIRLKKWLDSSERYQLILAEADMDEIKTRIQKEGPLSTHAFDSQIRGTKKMWSRPPHKIALDYMWYCGELATSHREQFKKFYDLSERVIPHNLRQKKYSDRDQINWLCNAALDRLSFGTLKDIQKFWDATTLDEVKKWYSRNPLMPIKWQTSDGKWIDSFAHPDIEKRLDKMSKPTSRLRIINPFDPAVRDRDRLKDLFGFDYKIEIFVPAAKRVWGYYVYPLLEGDRFVGRIELKADRKNAVLNVIKFWPESGIKWGAERKKKLEKELNRLAKLINADKVNWPTEN
ncbi:MAG: YcaQ family DNA glycosylase [Kordiimonadaceae bacterium]|nr:YcaQ family DNA glycosylase [Kordiimonadaceae bacterium]